MQWPGIDILRDTTITRCEGSTVLLRTDAGYASYLWSQQSGGTDSITVLASSTATYWVQVADAGGCRGTSRAVTILASARPKPVPQLTLRDRHRAERFVAFHR